MSETSPVAIIKAFMAAMAVKDYDKALPYVADDCAYTNIPMGTVTGPRGMRDLLEPFFAPTIENEFRVLREVVSGDTVVLERLDRHLLPDGWVELPVTGIFEIRDGKIALWRDYFDLATIMTKWPSA
ncbi:MAG: hypothetical protein GC184_00160 [Rhizobiales bacterium]|nr:hypothetical protein [Hyphomicrobiales bacterium]